MMEPCWRYCAIPIKGCASGGNTGGLIIPARGTGNAAAAVPSARAAFCSAAAVQPSAHRGRYLTGKYTEKTRGEINTLSGVFPTDDKALNRFCKLYTSCAQGATCWRCGMWGPSGR